MAMIRKSFLAAGLVVTLILSLAGTQPTQAIIDDLNLSFTTCASVIATINYIFGGGPYPPAPNTLNYSVFVTGSPGTVLASGSRPAPDADDIISIPIAWTAQPNGTNISVRVVQVDNGGGEHDETIRSYNNCTGGTTPGGGTPGSGGQPSTSTGPNAPTYTDAAVASETQRGIQRLFSSGTAVVYRMPNGDIQFYRITPQAVGRWIGTTPGAQMNPSLYQPGQYVGQFGYGDGWYADLYFHAWNTWHAFYTTESGAFGADVWFQYGNPNTNPGSGGGSEVPRPRQQGTTPPATQNTAPQVVQPPQGYINANPAVPWPFLDPSIAGINPATAGSLAQPQPGYITPANPGQVQPPLQVPSQVQTNPNTPPAGIASPAFWQTVLARYGATVRAERNESSALLAALDPGTLVTLVGRDSTSQWVLAILPSGQYGWIAASVLADVLPQIAALPAVQ